MKKMIGSVLFLLGLAVMIFSIITRSFNHLPIAGSKETTTWQYHDSVENAGWSQEKLNVAFDYYRSLNSTAVLAVYDGKILFEWGDVTNNTNAHSVRKSFLSALYGIHVNQGVNLQATLKDLEINEIEPLSELELEAKVVDLLTSRSGVFLRSGEESWNMKRKRPVRGKFAPGSFFYYNNWDFNVVGTIFQKQTEKDLFTEFYEKIAQPIGMEQFTLEQTDYKYDTKTSLHPSYLFQMSAWDMARFGQLFLQKGEWDGQQIISRDWIEESTSVQANVPGNDVYDYGYMWWVVNTGPLREAGMFSAIGRYGQSIDILPGENIVFVHRVNSNERGFLSFQKTVNQKERLRLLQLVLEAKQK